MTKTENVSSYLTRISQVHDELGAVGEKVDNTDLVIWMEHQFNVGRWARWSMEFCSIEGQDSAYFGGE